LLCALEEGRKSQLDGRDNLRTMALVEACYQSAREHRAVALCEIESAN
jgi:predicted dehydrogenase